MIRLTVVVRVEPLLHLLGGEIDSITLASTAHGEVAVEGGDVGGSILGGDDLESSWGKLRAR